MLSVVAFGSELDNRSDQGVTGETGNTPALPVAERGRSRVRGQWVTSGMT